MRSTKEDITVREKLIILTSYLHEASLGDCETFQNRLEDFKIVLQNMFSTSENDNLLNGTKKFPGNNAYAESRAALVDAITAHKNRKQAYDIVVNTLKEKLKDMPVLQALSPVLPSSSHSQPTTQDDETTTGTVKDHTNSRGTALNRWLYDRLYSIVQVLGGSVEIHQMPSTEEKLQLVISGSFRLKYSVLSTFLEHQDDTKKTLLSISHASPHTDFTFYLNTLKLKKDQRQFQNLELIRQWLQSQGYNVDDGGKSCASVFSKATPVLLKRDYEVRQKFGLTLEAAQQLGKEKGRVVTPLAIHITTYCDNLMQQLEAYYKDVGLTAHDGRNKKFVDGTRGPGQLHESNLSLGQAQLLRPYLERLDMFSRLLGKKCSELSNEAQVTTSSQQLRSIHYQELEKRIKEWTLDRSTRRLAAAGVNRPAIEYASTICTENTWTENKFEQKVELLVNGVLVFGPDAYQLLQNQSDLSLATTCAQIHDTTHQERTERASSSTTSSFIAHTASSNTPPNFQLVTRHPRCNTSGSTTSTYSICDYYDELARVFFHQGVRNILVSPSNRCNEIKEFFQYHTPYYLIQQLTSNISEMLDHPAVTNEQVESVLVSLGVPSEQLSLYRVAGTEEYNRYQVKFNLLPLVLLNCIQNDILMNVHKLANNKHPWVQDVGCPNDYAKDPMDCLRILEWKINQLYECGWGSVPANADNMHKLFNHAPADTQPSKITNTAGSTTPYSGNHSSHSTPTPKGG